MLQFQGTARCPFFNLGYTGQHEQPPPSRSGILPIPVIPILFQSNNNYGCVERTRYFTTDREMELQANIRSCRCELVKTPLFQAGNFESGEYPNIAPLSFGPASMHHAFRPDRVIRRKIDRLRGHRLGIGQFFALGQTAIFLHDNSGELNAMQHGMKEIHRWLMLGKESKRIGQYRRKKSAECRLISGCRSLLP